MIRRAAILVSIPVIIAALITVPLGVWKGDHHWLCAAVALALTVPAGLITLILAERLSRTSPYGNVVAMAVGTFTRVVVGFGGAAIVFLLSGDTFRTNPLSYWAWILGMYLVTLTVEIALLSSPAPAMTPKSDSQTV